MSCLSWATASLRFKGGRERKPRHGHRDSSSSRRESARQAPPQAQGGRLTIISFAWTTPALLAHEKTVTRRAWKPQHAAKFHAGQLVDAWDKSPRYGGKKVAVIKLVQDPYQENSAAIPKEDFKAEGFDYLLMNMTRGETANHVDDIVDNWIRHPHLLWVVRFELVSILKPDTPLANLTLKPDTCRGVNP